ncbi:MAG TPA: glycosyltransferase [Kineosporiaceae bacterium]|nr:glycosyltransferase [Kineosporiaceae bacterium]
MRIAMVSEHASPLATLGGVDAGGQNVHVACLARALAARGHEVDIYTRRDNLDLPERVRLAPRVQVVHVPAGPAQSIPKDALLEWMPTFGDWLAGAWSGPTGRRGLRRPDVVHAHFWMSGVAAVRAVQRLEATAGPAGAIPVVQTFHALGSVKRRFQGLDDTSPPERIATERMLAEFVDQVIATCSDEVQEIDRMQAVPKDVRIVPCGVDLHRFTPTGPRSLPAGRIESGTGTRLLCVGRLVERKGVDTVVQALAQLPQCQLVVAGGPAFEDLNTDAEAIRLRALADDLGVGDRVQLIGRVGHTELPSLLRWADIVVATPWYEPFGIVPLEAMACGRPFIGSAVGGLLDTVVPGVNGQLVAPRDPQELADGLRAMLADPPKLEAMGRAARQIMLSGYGWDRIAEQVVAAYSSVVGTGAGAAELLMSAEAM